MRETEESLLAAAKRNQADAFGRLILGYEKLIYSIAVRYFNNPEDARDLAQEAIIKIYKGLPGVKLSERTGSLKSWICAVTVNTCLDELRKRKARPVTIPEQPEHDIGTDVHSPEAVTLANERVREIVTAIGELNDEHRTLVILRDLNGLSYQELADATSVPVNTVKSRLSRARAALKQKLDSKTE